MAIAPRPLPVFSSESTAAPRPGMQLAPGRATVYQYQNQGRGQRKKPDADFAPADEHGSPAQGAAMPEPELGTPGRPTLRDILQVIMDTRKELETKIDAPSTDLGLLREDQRHLTEQVTTEE
ncbi:hypothetical protein NDU88_000421 [Pleurodeles waltl]|uniref:Uncharacterized protein n=1 Tax=Pleurodeles waltl TaxID=8319 RepID=A0AAV7TFF7_PLEWA|nr:hypothetical protein NDU88_000421 [Pleurodeles waltl]